MVFPTRVIQKAKDKIWRRKTSKIFQNCPIFHWEVLLWVGQNLIVLGFERNLVWFEICFGSGLLGILWGFSPPLPFNLSCYVILPLLTIKFCTLIDLNSNNSVTVIGQLWLVQKWCTQCVVDSSHTCLSFKEILWLSIGQLAYLFWLSKSNLVVHNGICSNPRSSLLTCCMIFGCLMDNQPIFWLSTTNFGCHGQLDDC